MENNQVTPTTTPQAPTTPPAPIQTPPPEGTPTPPPASNQSSGSFSEPQTESPHSSKKLFILLIVALLALVTAGVVLFMVQGGFSNSTTIPTPTPTQTVTTTPTVTPTPTRGTTDTDLEQDSQEIETNLNNLDTQTDAVQEGLQDQNPNLQ